MSRVLHHSHFLYLTIKLLLEAVNGPTTNGSDSRQTSNGNRMEATPGIDLLDDDNSEPNRHSKINNDRRNSKPKPCHENTKFSKTHQYLNT